MVRPSATIDSLIHHARTTCRLISYRTPRDLVPRVKAPEPPPAVSNVEGLGAVSQKGVFPVCNIPGVMDGGPVKLQLVE